MISEMVLKSLFKVGELPKCKILEKINLVRNYVYQTTMGIFLKHYISKIIQPKAIKSIYLKTFQYIT